MAFRNVSQEEELDLLSNAPSATQPEDDLDLLETKEKLLALKRQMEEYERRERELENLRLRRQEVVSGQKMMREKLARALTTLERAEYESRREVEHIQLARQTFSEHLQQLEEITPSEWTPEEMDETIGKAMSQIDHARAVYNQSRARINALNGQDFEGSSDDESENFEGNASWSMDRDSFLNWTIKGFAFTLPLLIALAILMTILLLRGG
ncbi:MAG: hypothetical protein ACOY3I_00520 [Verrucomicrobiota bacterium]